MKQSRMPVFAERFLQLRGQLSQEEFAKKVGLSRPTVSFYESGERLPDALKLRQIAEKCNVSVDWLLGLTDVKSPNGNVRIVSEVTGLSESAVEQLHSSEPLADFISIFIDEMGLVVSHAIEKASIIGYAEQKGAVELVSRIGGKPTERVNVNLWPYFYGHISSAASLVNKYLDDCLSSIAHKRAMTLKKVRARELITAVNELCFPEYVSPDDINSLLDEDEKGD